MSGNITPEIWAIIGLVLIVLDMLTYTFVFFFFGISALLTALISWTGLVKSLSWQLVFFSAFSLVSLVVFRKWAKQAFGKNKGAAEYSDLVGQTAYVAVKIPAGGEGKVSFRGSDWLAHSASGGEIEQGAKVVIEEVEGIKLKVSVKPN